MKKKEEILPTKWFKIEQISTWIGESLGSEKPVEELKGGHKQILLSI